MRTIKLAVTLVVVLVSMIAAGCALNEPRRSTTTNVTRDHSYVGDTFQSVLVIGVLKDETLKRQFESGVAQKLRDAGISSVASHTIFPTAEQLTKENVQAYLKEADIDAVLVTRIVGMESETFETAAETGPSSESLPWNEFRGSKNLWADSATVYQTRGSPGYAVEENVVSTEITLFETKEGARVWNADRKSTLTGNRSRTISEIGTMIVSELQAGNLI